MRLVTEQSLDQLEAWNQSSVQLIHAAKVNGFIKKNLKRQKFLVVFLLL